MEIYNIHYFSKMKYYFQIHLQIHLFFKTIFILNIIDFMKLFE
jgi:hypothetical protein